MFGAIIYFVCRDVQVTVRSAYQVNAEGGLTGHREDLLQLAGPAGQHNLSLHVKPTLQFRSRKSGQLPLQPSLARTVRPAARGSSKPGRTCVCNNFTSVLKRLMAGVSADMCCISGT